MHGTAMLSKRQQVAWISISLKLVSLTKDCYFQLSVPTLVYIINLLLTEREGRTREYWPAAHAKTTKIEYSSIRLKYMYM